MRIDVSGKILKYVRQRFFHSATFAPFFGVGDQILHEHAFAGENSWLLVVSWLLAPYSSLSSRSVASRKRHKKHLRVATWLLLSKLKSGRNRYSKCSSEPSWGSEKINFGNSFISLRSFLSQLSPLSFFNLNTKWSLKSSLDAFTKLQRCWYVISNSKEKFYCQEQRNYKCHILRMIFKHCGLSHILWNMYVKRKWQILLDTCFLLTLLLLCFRLFP